MTGNSGGRGETECWSKKVKSLLFFCPAPVARPLLPPLSSQSCSPGERAEQKCTKALCERVSCRRRFCPNVHVFCVLICLSVKKKKKQSLHKGGKNPGLSSETNDFHCK